MLQAPFLKTGDRIRIVAPAGKVQPEKITPGIQLLEQQGFEVVIGPHVFDPHFQFASTDVNRLQDMQEAMDDHKCKAIICARGGYGAIRIVDQLSFEQFQHYPKWLVGFSDITVLHASFQQQGYCSIHGPMPAYYDKEGAPTESFLKLIQLLTGQPISYILTDSNDNRYGTTSGKLVGGNLSILHSLTGTPLQPQTQGKILFIEDLSEYLYHTDRMIRNLKLSGMFDGLSALLVGSFTDMRDNDSPFGQNVNEIIREAVNEYSFPVVFNCPSGHIDENMPLVFGADYSLITTSNSTTLSLITNDHF